MKIKETILLTGRLQIKKVIAAVLCAVFLLSGCTVDGKQVVFSFGSPFIVFSIGPLSCGKKEAKVYLANYKNIYGSIGETDLWSGDFDTTDIEEGIRHSAIYHLSRVYSLDLYAKESDITLDESERNKITQAAKEYYDSLSEKEKKTIGVHLRDIRKCYEHYVLAEKVYAQLMESVDDEVSEDEARIMDAYILYVKNEKMYKKIKEELKEGAEFEQLVSAYSQGEKGIVSFGRGTYPQNFEEAAFSLEDDEVSGGIKTDDGYYFVKCVDKYDEDLSEENKEKIIKGRKQDVFQKIIDTQNEKYYSRINTALLNKMIFGSDEEIQTDSFFSTIEDYISYD